MAQLTSLWKALTEQIEATGQLIVTEAHYVDGDGIAYQFPAARLGAMGLIDDKDYLAWNSTRWETTNYRKLPGITPTLSSIKSFGQRPNETLLIAPSRGKNSRTNGLEIRTKRQAGSQWYRRQNQSLPACYRITDFSLSRL